jgi:phi13 family phage major tail protein
MATIGLRDVYYALLLTDPVGGTPTYGAPVRLAGAISAAVNPNTSSATLFTDDGPGDVAATLGEISLELNLADIPLDAQSVLLGASLAGGILKSKATDVAPWLAIGFRTLKSNGSYRYVWLAKGKFTVPEDDFATKADSIEFKTPTIKGAFVRRDSDDEWKRQADQDIPGSTTAITNWFNGPMVGASVPVASITVAPATLSLSVASNPAYVLGYVVIPTNSTNQHVTFTSSDATKASVDANGVITAKAAGTATITVTSLDGAKTGTCTVTVTA